MERSGAIPRNRIFAPDLEPRGLKNLHEPSRSRFFRRLLLCRRPPRPLHPTPRHHSTLRHARRDPASLVTVPSLRRRGGRRVSEKELVACPTRADGAHPGSRLARRPPCSHHQAASARALLVTHLARALLASSSPPHRLRLDSRRRSPC
jgi:hypothetical protein